MDIFTLVAITILVLVAFRRRAGQKLTFSIQPALKVANHWITIHSMGSLVFLALLWAVDAYAMQLRFGGPVLFSLGDESVTLIGTALFLGAEAMANLWIWNLRLLPWDY